MEDTSSRIPLFVYGTLLRDESNHQLLAAARFRREVATEPGFRLLDLGDFPGMVKAGNGHVQGELFEIRRAMLAELDRLEGHPHFYWRTEIRLADRSRATTYLLVDERYTGSPVISSGDWRQHRSARRTAGA